MSRIKRFLLYWPEAWLDLIDAICWILTLGQWKPNLGIKYCIYINKKRKQTNK